MAKTARDLMEEPVFIESEASIEEVKEKFRQARDALMVKDGGDFVGEIHENSLLNLLIPEELIDEERVIGILGLSINKQYFADEAGDLMNRHEITVPPDEEVGKVAFLMAKEDVRAIPVEENGEIVGVVHEDRLVEEI